MFYMEAPNAIIVFGHLMRLEGLSKAEFDALNDILKSEEQVIHAVPSEIHLLDPELLPPRSIVGMRRVCIDGDDSPRRVKWDNAVSHAHHDYLERREHFERVASRHERIAHAFHDTSPGLYLMSFGPNAHATLAFGEKIKRVDRARARHTFHESTSAEGFEVDEGVDGVTVASVQGFEIVALDLSLEHMKRLRACVPDMEDPALYLSIRETAPPS